MTGVRRSVTHSFRASLVLSIFLTLVLIVSCARLMYILNVPPAIYDDSYNFIDSRAGNGADCRFQPAFGVYPSARRQQNAAVFLIFSSVLNIIFNLILIKFCRLGVIGSAVGTVIAISISVVCCIIYIKRNYPILRLKKEDWAYNPAFMREHLNIAIPMSIQFSILALSIMVIQAVCNSFGEKIIVGFTIALRIEQLATQPLMAIRAGNGNVCRPELWRPANCRAFVTPLRKPA